MSLLDLNRLTHNDKSVLALDGVAKPAYPRPAVFPGAWVLDLQAHHAKSRNMGSNGHG